MGMKSEIKPTTAYPLTTFSRHYRQKYGEPVGKIALDAGVVCPNRRYGGCGYCAAEGYTPFYLEAGDLLQNQLRRGRQYLNRKGGRYYFAYFQQETTTALAMAELLPMFELAIAGEGCVGLIISTRPDYLTQEFVDCLEDVADQHPEKEFLVELGLQSAHDQTLTMINRNHSFQDFVGAAALLKASSRITFGVHLILGLPGETEKEMRQSVLQVRDLGIDYVKFHHLQILKGTRFAEMHRQNPFILFDPDGYCMVLARLLALLPDRIVLHRLWSTARHDLLVAPKWDLHANEMTGKLLAAMREQNLYQGKYASCHE